MGNACVHGKMVPRSIWQMLTCRAACHTAARPQYVRCCGSGHRLPSAGVWLANSAMRRKRAGVGALGNAHIHVGKVFRSASASALHTIGCASVSRGNHAQRFWLTCPRDGLDKRRLATRQTYVGTVSGRNVRRRQCGADAARHIASIRRRIFRAFKPPGCARRPLRHDSKVSRTLLAPWSSRAWLFPNTETQAHPRRAFYS